MSDRPAPMGYTSRAGGPSDREVSAEGSVIWMVPLGSQTLVKMYCASSFAWCAAQSLYKERTIAPSGSPCANSGVRKAFQA